MTTETKTEKPAEDLRTLMLLLGFNQRQYAEATGQHQPSVARALKTGKAPAETRALRAALVRLAKAGVDVRGALESRGQDEGLTPASAG